jgi:hypothetical protein
MGSGTERNERGDENEVVEESEKSSKKTDMKRGKGAEKAL